MEINRIHFGYKLVELADRLVHELKRPPMKRKKKNRRWVKKWGKRPKTRIEFVFKPMIEDDKLLVSESEGIIYGSVRALNIIKNRIPDIETKIALGLDRKQEKDSKVSKKY